MDLDGKHVCPECGKEYTDERTRLAHITVRYNRIDTDTLTLAKAWHITDNGATWLSPKRTMPLPMANSRPHVVPYGSRWILCQHDYWTASPSHNEQRRNHALFFTRDKGIAFTPALVFDVDATYGCDYGQIAVHDDRAAVIYTADTNMMNRFEDDTCRHQMVAEIHPLPDPASFVLFPRHRGAHVQQVTEDGRRCLRFTQDFGSAGVDLDANDPTTDTLHVALDVDTFRTRLA